MKKKNQQTLTNKMRADHLNRIAKRFKTSTTLCMYVFLDIYTKYCCLFWKTPHKQNLQQDKILVKEQTQSTHQSHWPYGKGNSTHRLRSIYCFAFLVFECQICGIMTAHRLMCPAISPESLLLQQKKN